MTDKREECRKRLKEWAESLIVDANSLEYWIEESPHAQDDDLTGVLDPEPWQVIRHYARKILEAVETGSHIDPKWADAIEAALDSMQDYEVGQ